VASFNEFKQRDEAAAALARRIGERLRFAVYRRACASMIVSVAAPRPLFRTLRLLPVPWYLVTIVPSDEGWVPVDDDDSNEGLIRREILPGEPGFANFVSLYRRNRAAPDSLPELHASLKEIRLYGDKKRAVYENSLRPGPVEQYPVRALVRQERVPVNVYWAP